MKCKRLLQLLKCCKNIFLHSIFFLSNRLYIFLFNEKSFFLSKNFVIQRKYIYIQSRYICKKIYLYSIKIYLYLKILYFYPGLFYVRNISSFNQKKNEFNKKFKKYFTTQFCFLFGKSKVHFYRQWFFIRLYHCAQLRQLRFSSSWISRNLSHN